MELSKFDRFDELVEKVNNDGYLKEYYGDYSAETIAKNMVLYAPEEFKQNLYEYIDGDIVIDKNGLWSFGPFTNIKLNGVSLNDVLDYYKEQVLFRQKYSNSWLKCIKYINNKIQQIPTATRVLHPIAALRILVKWQECGYLNEYNSAQFCGSKPQHWKHYFVISSCGWTQNKEEARWETKFDITVKLHPAIYGKFEYKNTKPQH